MDALGLQIYSKGSKGEGGVNTIIVEVHINAMYGKGEQQQVEESRDN